MTMKIKVSYTEEAEAAEVIKCLKPLSGRLKVKKCIGKPPYKHIYFSSKKSENAENTAVSP